MTFCGHGTAPATAAGRGRSRLSVKSSRETQRRRRRPGRSALTGGRLAAILLVACLSECAAPNVALPLDWGGIAAAGEQEATSADFELAFSAPEHRGYPLWSEGAA